MLLSFLNTYKSAEVYTDILESCLSLCKLLFGFHTKCIKLSTERFLKIMQKSPSKLYSHVTSTYTFDSTSRKVLQQYGINFFKKVQKFLINTISKS